MEKAYQEASFHVWCGQCETVVGEDPDGLDLVTVKRTENKNAVGEFTMTREEARLLADSIGKLLAYMEACDGQK
jgi:hypothetical protein